MLKKTFAALPLLLLWTWSGQGTGDSMERIAAQIAARKTSAISDQTPPPARFIVRGTSLLDLRENRKVFFKGMGYSPYLRGETPLLGGPPADDGRYEGHLRLLQDLGVNYLHVFPRQMPAGFFAELDETDLHYGQDIWLFAYAYDVLDPAYHEQMLSHIKGAIDHTYRVGRPDRLVLFSIGDELQPETIARTDARHPDVRAFEGRHIQVSNRTPSEIAVARLMDAAMDYELTTYGRRHLYCHTSFTHVGPLADRYDLEVPFLSALTPDIGDLICLNVYTYARGVVSSAPGSGTGTAYQGYLEQLAAQSSKPIFVTQAGLSTSPIEPKPWVPGFGGHPVEQVAVTFRSIWKDIRTAQGREKFCGLSFFEFQDEWWKSGEDPSDPVHHEPRDPEEWFGIYEIGEGNRLLPKGRIPDTVKEIFGGR